MSNSATSQVFLSNVYSTAKSTGAATQKCVELVKSGAIVWRGNDGGLSQQAKAVALEFRLGRIAAYLGLKTRAQALTVNDKSQPSKDPTGDSDKRRTPKEQLAYRAGVSAWEHIARLAGMPARGSDTPREPKAGTAAAKAAAAKKLASKGRVLVEPKQVTSQDDAFEFLVKLADQLGHWSRQNAKIVPVELKKACGAFATAIGAFAAAESASLDKAAKGAKDGRPAEGAAIVPAGTDLAV